MCGRIGQYLPSSYLEQFFHIDRFADNVPENYNLAPTETAMVVRIDPATGKRAIAVMKWGLVPFFSKTGRMDYATFNARCEGVEKAASFRAAYKSRRCIVPADLYYEWKPLDDSKKPAKQAYAVARADGEPLLLAGLWETWKAPASAPADGPESQPLRSFTILTAASTPGSRMAALHSRMPVILAPDTVDLWLGEREGDLAGLMKPCPDEWLKMWKVGSRVGNPRNKERSLIDEVA